MNDVDINNCTYSDIFMALAKKLLEQLSEENIDIDRIFLRKLDEWFTERIEKHEKTKEFAADLKSGAGAKLEVPFLANLFTKITTSLKTNSTYKEDLRKIIKNSFSEFSDALNDLIGAAEITINGNNKGKKLLFIVDATDSLERETAKQFFISNRYQLHQLEANFIYCASIHLLYKKSNMSQLFEPYTLPMIRIREKRNQEKLNAGYETLRQIIYKRVKPELFDSVETVDYTRKESGFSRSLAIQIVQKKSAA